MGTLATIAKLAAYSLLLRPTLYGLVRRLPLGLGLTPYETDYPIQAYDRTLGGLAALQLDRLGSINGTRVLNAKRLRDALSGCREVTSIVPLAGSEPVYARFPAMARANSRAEFIERLEAAGVGATPSYPRALIDVPEVTRRLCGNQRLTPGAREVARRIVTMPTHAYSPPGLAERIRTVAEQFASMA